MEATMADGPQPWSDLVACLKRELQHLQEIRELRVDGLSKQLQAMEKEKDNAQGELNSALAALAQAQAECAEARMHAKELEERVAALQAVLAQGPEKTGNANVYQETEIRAIQAATRAAPTSPDALAIKQGVQTASNILATRSRDKRAGLPGLDLLLIPKAAGAVATAPASPFSAEATTVGAVEPASNKQSQEAAAAMKRMLESAPPLLAELLRGRSGKSPLSKEVEVLGTGGAAPEGAEEVDGQDEGAVADGDERDDAFAMPSRLDWYKFTIGEAYPPPKATHEQVVKSQGLFEDCLDQLLSSLALDARTPFAYRSTTVLHHTAYVKVCDAGGLAKVTRNRTWGRIATSLGVLGSTSSALKRWYITQLWDMEQVYFHSAKQRTWPPGPFGPSSTAGGSKVLQPQARKQGEGELSVGLFRRSLSARCVRDQEPSHLDNPMPLSAELYLGAWTRSVDALNGQASADAKMTHTRGLENPREVLVALPGSSYPDPPTHSQAELLADKEVFERCHEALMTRLGIPYLPTFIHKDNSPSAYLFYKNVCEQGGYLEIVKYKQWNKLCTSIGVSVPGATSYWAKVFYLSQLWHMEQVYLWGRRGSVVPPPFTVVRSVKRKAPSADTVPVSDSEEEDDVHGRENQTPNAMASRLRTNAHDEGGGVGRYRGPSSEGDGGGHVAATSAEDRAAAALTALQGDDDSGDMDRQTFRGSAVFRGIVRGLRDGGRHADHVVMSRAITTSQRTHDSVATGRGGRRGAGRAVVAAARDGREQVHGRGRGRVGRPPGRGRGRGRGRSNVFDHAKARDGVPLHGRGRGYHLGVPDAGNSVSETEGVRVTYFTDADGDDDDDDDEEPNLAETTYQAGDVVMEEDMDELAARRTEGLRGAKPSAGAQEGQDMDYDTFPVIKAARSGSQTSGSAQ